MKFEGSLDREFMELTPQHAPVFWAGIDALIEHARRRKLVEVEGACSYNEHTTTPVICHKSEEAIYEETYAAAV